jgi:hypothetical protein
MATRRLENYVPIDQTVFTTDYAVGGGVVQKIIENTDCLNNRSPVLRETTPLGLYPPIPQNCVLVTTYTPTATAGFQTKPGEAFHAGRSNILRTSNPDSATLANLTGWRYGAAATDRDVTSKGAFSDSGVNQKSFHVLDGPVVVARRKPNDQPAASISWTAMGVTTPFGTPSVVTGRDYIVLAPGTSYFLAEMVDSFYEFWGPAVGQEVDCTAAGPSLSDQYHLTVRTPYATVFPGGANGRSGPRGYWGLRLTAKDNSDEVYYYESRHARLHYDGVHGHPYKNHSVDFLLLRNTRKEGISSVPFPEGLLVRLRNNEFTCLVFRVAQPLVFHTERQTIFAGYAEQSLARYVPGADAIRLPPLFNRRAAQIVSPVMHRVTGPKTKGKVAGLDVLEKQGRKFFAVSEGQVITTGCLPLANRSSFFQPIIALVNTIPSRSILENGICQIDSTVTYGTTVNTETNFIEVGATGLFLANYPENFYTGLELNNRDFYPLKDAITNLEGLGGGVFFPNSESSSTYSPTVPDFDGTDTPLTVEITVGDVTVDGGSVGQPQYIQFS